MKFWKLHGAGNDFVAINETNSNLDQYSEMASKICHRNFGVGADGLLIAKNSKNADIKMCYFNSDGSKAKMCGNGLRCFAKYVYDNQLVNNAEFTVETLAGIFDVKIQLSQEKQVQYISVNMGEPILNARIIPVDTKKEVFVDEELVVLDKTYKVSTILVGVPHTVVFVDKIDKNEIIKVGPIIEKHNLFPENTNVNFVEIINEENIKVYTWERGCGYTLACGTGICAAAYIAHYLEKTCKNMVVASQGGTLKIDIENNCINMIGDAVKICEGILEDRLWQ